MAMTLSGDGTIGGLVAGGLPDNSITTNDIAANAVSEGKLASNLYACKAWVNFNGTGTVAIRGSGNVSSITDNTTGTYTVNFATAMPDANYSMLATSGGTSASIGVRIDNPTNITTTTAGPFLCLNNSFASQDALFVNVAIFR